VRNHLVPAPGESIDQQHRHPIAGVGCNRDSHAAEPSHPNHAAARAARAHRWPVTRCGGGTARRRRPPTRA
jgi:hypothetical protein